MRQKVDEYVYLKLMPHRDLNHPLYKYFFLGSVSLRNPLFFMMIRQRQIMDSNISESQCLRNYELV